MPWDPWEAVQTPIYIGSKDPKARVEEPEDRSEEPEGDTIVVDTGDEGAYLTEESTILIPKSWEEAIGDPINKHN